MVSEKLENSMWTGSWPLCYFLTVI